MKRNKSGRIPVRVANPSTPRNTSTMATKKKRAKKRAKRRSNPATKSAAHKTKKSAAPRKRRRRTNPGNPPKRRTTHRRRRRNPGGPESATMGAVKALVAGVATGVLCMVAAAYIPSRWAGYGLSAAGVAGGVGLASMGHKSLGLGVAVGAATGSLVPLAGSKVLAALAPKSSNETMELGGYAPAYPNQFINGYQPAYPGLGMGTVVTDLGTVVTDMGTVVTDLGGYGPAYPNQFMGFIG
jgi:hypothetical protein